MNRITLKQKNLKPHDTVEGSVSWQLENAPKNLELRLFWFTRGRGEEEAGTISTLPLGDASSGEKVFSFPLPGSPWSIDGTYISIVWGVELVERKAGGLALEEFTVGPEGVATKLRRVESPESEGRLSKKLRKMFPTHS